ncbi:MAG: hypothetical protein JNM17_24550, partial [Archangium sp.]|nr:hypothetical protein [Archangium sp.]
MQEIAVCPRITFVSSSTPDIQLFEYTDDPGSQCTPASVTPDPNLGFIPQCVGSKPSSTELPIHVAREQWYDPQCRQSGPHTIVGPGDVIALNSGTSCAAETQVIDYQLSLQDVDAQLGSTFLNGLDATELLLKEATFARFVDVFVFDNLPPGVPFHCPSGVNLEFQSWADSATVRVRQYRLSNPSDTQPDSDKTFATEIRP